MVNRISAQIIADSINEQGDRLTTYILVFPRIVLAEFNTHRMISKNSASSRAIPFKTMVQKAIDEPFVPIAFQREHKGMQGTDYFTENDYIDVTHLRDSEMALSGATNETTDALPLLEAVWLAGRDAAVEKARLLSGLGVTKQLANRQLEAYLYHTVICTGTEWENFFALRAHPAAEIHIADLAQKMLDTYNRSQPILLKGGEYHIPFGDTFDPIRLLAVATENGAINYTTNEALKNAITQAKLKIAIARCARVSYLNFEGKDDYLADIKLFHTLTDMGHMSPTEHVGIAADKAWYRSGNGDKGTDWAGRPSISADGWSGNFKGFIQYRKIIDGENKTDGRVLNKHL